MSRGRVKNLYGKTFLGCGGVLPAVVGGSPGRDPPPPLGGAGTTTLLWVEPPACPQIPEVLESGYSSPEIQVISRRKVDLRPHSKDE